MGHYLWREELINCWLRREEWKKWWLWREELRNCCLRWDELKHTHTHHCTILLGEACAWGGLPSFSVPVRGGTMHSDYCAETLLAYSWGRRGGLNGEWHSCLLFQLTHLLASVVGGSLRVKLHYLVGEVHNDLIAGVLGRFFNGETALPCWWMKTYLLGCSLGSGIKLLHYRFTSISRRSTYWVVVFGVAMLFFRAEESKNCTTSLDEFHKHFLAGLLFGVATVWMKELHYLFEWNYTKTYMTSCSFAVVGRLFRVATGRIKKLHYLAKELHEDLLVWLGGDKEEFAQLCWWS